MRGHGRIAAYLEERLELPTIWARFTDRPLPKGVGWLHTFGSATLFLLLVQAITGVFLAFYYVPSPEHAYESVRLITSELAFGRIVRGVHGWGASLVVVFIGLHLLRTLFMGSFTEGLEVYARAGCSACHTIDGQGGSAGPDLSRVGQRRSEEWLVRYTRDPRSTNPSAEMPPFSELTDEELRALAAYLGTRR